jgi:hypothetical protein
MVCKSGGKNAHPRDKATPSAAARGYGSDAESPNHRRTAVSTATSCAESSLPKARSSFACGIVMRFWASKAPAFKNGSEIDASKRDPRTLVVGNQRCKRAVAVVRGNADDERRSDLGGHAEVN